MAVYVAIVAIATAVYLGVKYFIVNLSMMAYIYWMEEKRSIQPTRDELDACKRKILQEMFK